MEVQCYALFAKLGGQRAPYLPHIHGVPLKSSQELLSGIHMEQAPSRGHEASPQSGLGVGCKRCSSSKKLRGLGVRAQARRISISLSFSVAFFFPSFLSPPRSVTRQPLGLNPTPVPAYGETDAQPRREGGDQRLLPELN